MVLESTWLSALRALAQTVEAAPAAEAGGGPRALTAGARERRRCQVGRRDDVSGDSRARMAYIAGFLMLTVYKQCAFGRLRGEGRAGSASLCSGRRYTGSRLISHPLVHFYPAERCCLKSLRLYYDVVSPLIMVRMVEDHVRRRADSSPMRRMSRSRLEGA